MLEKFSQYSRDAFLEKSTADELRAFIASFAIITGDKKIELTIGTIACAIMYSFAWFKGNHPGPLHA